MFPPDNIKKISNIPVKAEFVCGYSYCIHTPPEIIKTARLGGFDFNFLAHPARFERAIPAFGGRCSILLSHGCIGHNYKTFRMNCKGAIYRPGVVLYPCHNKRFRATWGFRIAFNIFSPFIIAERFIFRPIVSS